MDNQFNIGVGVQAIPDNVKIQSDINKKVKNVAVKATLKLDSNNKQFATEVGKLKNTLSQQFNVNIDNKTAVKSLSEIKKAYADVRKEAYQSIGTKSPELSQMAKYYSDLEKQSSSFSKKNLSAIDLEIQKRVEQSRIFSSQIKSQMQERIATENKVQSELAETAKKAQASLNLDMGKTTLDNKISTYLNNNTKLSQKLRSELVGLQSQIKNVDSTGLKNLEKGFRTVTSSAQALGETGNSAFTKLIKNSKQFLSYLGSATLIMTGVNAIKSMIRSVVELDTSLVELQKVSDLSGQALTEFTDKAFKLGAQVAKTGKDVIDAVAVFKRAGYTLQESFDLSKVSLMMVNVGDGINNVEDASSALISVLKGAKLSETDAIKVLDMINSTSNNAAIGFSDITEGLRRVTGTLSQTGTSVEQIIGLLTGGFSSLRDIESVSSGLIMISQRLRGVGEDGEAIEGLAPRLKKSFKEIADIDIEDANGNLRSTYDIVSDMARVFPTLTSKQRQYLGELAAGNRQIKVLNAIVDGWSDVSLAIDSAVDSEGSALEENDKVLNSIKGRINALNSAFQQLASNTLDSTFTKVTIDALTSVVSLIDKIGLLNIALTTAAAIVGAKTVIGINAFSGALASLATKIGLVGVASTTASMALSTMLPVAGIILAITGIKKAFDHFNVTAEETQANLDNSKETYDSATSEVKKLKEEIEGLATKLEELNAIENPTAIQKEEIENAKKLNEQLDRELRTKEAIQAIAEKELVDNAIAKINERKEDVDVWAQDSEGTYGYQKANKIESTQVYMDRIAENKKAIEDANEAQKEIEKSFENNADLYINDKAWLEKSKEIEILTDRNTLLGENIEKNMESLQANDDALYDSEGKVKSGAESTTEALDVLYGNYDEYSGVAEDLSESNKDLNDSLANDASQSVSFGFSLSEEQSTAIEEYKKSIQTIKDSYNDLANVDVTDLMGQFTAYDWTPFLTGAKDIKTVLSELANDELNSVISQFDDLKTTYGTMDNSSFILQALRDTGNLSNEFDILNTRVDETSKTLGVLDSAIANVKSGQALTKSEVSELITLYPQLTSSISETADGYIIEANSLVAVRDQIYQTETAMVDAQINQTQTAINGAKERIKSYIEEIKVLSQLVLAAQFADIDGKAIDGVNLQQGKLQDLQRALDNSSTSLANLEGNLTSLQSTRKKLDLVDKPTSSDSSSSKKDKDAEESKFTETIDFAAEKTKVLENALSRLEARLQNTTTIKGQTKIYNEMIAKQTELADSYSKTAEMYNNQYLSALSKLPKEYQDKVKNGAISVDLFEGLGDDSNAEILTGYIQESIDLRDKVSDANVNYSESVAQIAENAASLAELKWNKAEETIDGLNDKLSLLDDKLSNATNTKEKNKLLQDQLNIQKEITKEMEKAVSSNERDLASTKTSLLSSSSDNGYSDDVLAKIRNSMANNKELNLSGLTSEDLTLVSKYNAELVEMKLNNDELLAQKEKEKSFTADVKTQTYDNKQSDYDNQVDSIKNNMQDVQNAISQVESMDGQATKQQLQSLILLSKKTSDVYEFKKKLAEKELATLSPDDTDRYVELQQEIQSCDDAISDVKVSQNEWNKSILELPLSKLEETNDALQKILSNLNSTKDRYDGIVSAVTDAIDEQIDKIEESQSVEEEYYNTLIENRNEELEALKDSNEEREFALELQQAQYDLERLKGQKTNKIYRAGSGMVKCMPLNIVIYCWKIAQNGGVPAMDNTVGNAYLV